MTTEELIEHTMHLFNILHPVPKGYVAGTDKYYKLDLTEERITQECRGEVKINPHTFEPMNMLKEGDIRSTSPFVLDLSIVGDSDDDT